MSSIQTTLSLSHDVRTWCFYNPTRLSSFPTAWSPLSIFPKSTTSSTFPFLSYCKTRVPSFFTISLLFSFDPLRPVLRGFSKQFTPQHHRSTINFRFYPLLISPLRINKSRIPHPFPFYYSCDIVNHALQRSLSSSSSSSWFPGSILRAFIHHFHHHHCTIFASSPTLSAIFYTSPRYVINNKRYLPIIILFL